MPLIPRETRDASFVTRWAISRCLKKQSIAEHSFYVAMYADMVADFIKWQGDRALLLRFAIWHDMAEVFTGDIPGPVKRDAEFKGSMRISHIVNDVFKPYGLYIEDLSEYKEHYEIIKVANLIDEVAYQMTEMQMGNRTLEKVTQHSQRRLKDAIIFLRCDRVTQNKLWEELQISFDVMLRGSSVFVEA